MNEAIDPSEAAGATNSTSAEGDTSGDDTSATSDDGEGEDVSQLFCGVGEFTWYKGPYRGRMHRVVQVAITLDKLDIEHYYSGRFVGYHKDLRRGLSFNLNNETGEYEFDRAAGILPMLIMDENRTTLTADFQADRQSVQLTEETCGTVPYNEQLATVRRR